MLRSEELKVDDVNEREIELVEDAYTYLTNKTFPADATKNEKRIIRKKAEKITIRNGKFITEKRRERFVWCILFCIAYLGTTCSYSVAIVHTHYTIHAKSYCKVNSV